MAALTGADPASDPKAPDIIVIPDPGVIYTGSTTKRAEHGGNSVDDRHVGLVVGGGAVQAVASGIRIPIPAATQMVAPTILRALGLDPMKLQGVAAESTPLLPGLFCREAVPSAAASCSAKPPASDQERCCTRVLSDPGHPSLRVNFRGNASLRSVRMWNVDPAGKAVPLLQSPAQTVDFAVSLGSDTSTTGCEVYPAGPSSMMGPSGMMGGMGMTMVSGNFMVACGVRGSILRIDYPNLVMAPQPLGAVHLRICVAMGDGDGTAPPDATLMVQT